MNRWSLVLGVVAGGWSARAAGLSDADLAAAARGSAGDTNAPALRYAIEDAATGCGGDVKALMDLQRRMLAALDLPDATPAGRAMILRAVQRMGFCVDVPAVARFLTDPLLSHPARLALEGIADPKADAALLAALAKAGDETRAGLVISLGLRRCPSADAAIAPLCDSKDAALASAALVALGRIATPPCLARLLRPAAPACESARLAALAACLSRMAVGAESALARRTATAVFGDVSAAPALRAAAVGVLLQTDPRAAPALLTKALADPQVKVREAAARMAASGLTGEAVTDALAAALPSAGVDDAVRILGAIRERGDARAAKAVAAAASGGAEPVRRSAIATLGAIGGADHAARLVEFLSDDAVRDAAMRALTDMPAKGVAAKLSAVATATADAGPRARLVQVLGARAGADGLSILAPFTKDADAAVRREAWRALRERARPADAAALADLLCTTPATESPAAEAALGTAVRPMESAERAKLLVATWGRAPAAARPPLARTMAYFADAGAVPVLSAAMKDADPGVREAAVRALAGWPDAAPAEALGAAAFELPTEAMRVLALRGAVRMIGATAGPEARERLADMFRRAPDAAGRQVVAAAIGEQAGTEAFAIYEGWFNDAALGPDAKKAFVALYDQMAKSPAGELDTKGWRADASHSPGSTARAFDRKDETRWDTGTPQVPGMWFTLDMGGVAAVARIDLDTGRSAGDTPNRYKAFTSLDGKSWNGPVAQGEGGHGATRIELKPPVPARHLRIEQLGEREGLFWSIHELRVTAGVDEALLKAAGAKAEGLR